MIKRQPSTGQILTMAIFALSCFGLLLFLWSSFGGAKPLAPRGYRIHVRLPDSGQLATQADVRINGVSVGKVISHGSEPKTGLSTATLEIDPKYVPRPSDTRVLLRQKTLLGEVYVSLTAGSKDAPPLPEGGTLQPAQVSHAVTLSEVFRTFDPTTRRNFQAWMTQQGAALGTSGRALNDALAQLDPFAEETDKLVSTVARQGEDTKQLLAEGGRALGAVTAEPGRLRALVRSTNAAFAATSRQQQQLAGTVKALGPFLGQSRITLDRLATFSRDATPLTDQLTPAARQLSGLLRDVPAATDPLGRLLRAAPAVERASRGGVPAADRILDQTEPLLTRLKPFLGEIIPVLSYASSYRRELAATLGNLAATTQSTLPGAAGGPLHLVRAIASLNPESLAAYPQRLRTDRTNPYFAPGAFDKLRTGLQSWTSGCGSAALPTVGDSVPADQRAAIERFYLTDHPANVACSIQSPLGPMLGQGASNFPQLTPLP